jgi:uncharacterized membrane protein
MMHSRKNILKNELKSIQCHFWHYYHWIFSIVYFVKLGPQRHVSVVTYGVSVCLWFIEMYMQNIVNFFHTLYLVTYGYNYHYYLYITMGILITQIESLNTKIMLIQEYFDSTLLLLIGLVATVLFHGGPFSFADQ